MGWKRHGAAWLLALTGCASKVPAPPGIKPIPAPAPSVPADTRAAGSVQAWLTTGDGTQQLARQPDIPATAAPPRPSYAQSFANRGEVRSRAPATIDIAIDTAQRRQTMIGFGAAISDASASLLVHGLDAPQRTALLQELFGAPPGLGLNFTRVAIGSSEFARARYSLADTEDPNLAAVSIEPDRDAVLPALKAALKVNPGLQIVATPYSAPGWMKTSGTLVGGALQPAAIEAYARYLKRFIDLYRQEGVPVFALTMQNEPTAVSTSAPADAPGMQLDAAARIKLAAQLGPMMTATRLLELDDNWREAAGAMTVLGDEQAAPHIAGTAWHCYGGDVAAQGVVHDAHPDKEIYLTECTGGMWAPGWADNLVHFGATAIVGSSRQWARGILLGNLALDARGGPHIGGCGNCRGVVTIEAGAVTRNPEYYALAHASRFVRPGAVNVASTGAVDGVSNAAFVNPDDSVVLVVVNAAAQARTVVVRSGDAGFATALPARSIATYTWQGYNRGP